MALSKAEIHDMRKFVRAFSDNNAITTHCFARMPRRVQQAMLKEMRKRGWHYVNYAAEWRVKRKYVHGDKQSLKRLGQASER